VSSDARNPARRNPDEDNYVWCARNSHATGGLRLEDERVLGRRAGGRGVTIVATMNLDRLQVHCKWEISAHSTAIANYCLPAAQIVQPSASF